MPYTAHNTADRRHMLEAIGIRDEEELLAGIPGELRFKGTLSIPGPLDEEAIRGLPLAGAQSICFAGGGIYRHHVPAVVDAICSRQEYLTAYTPYQPEISQGTLQSIFEYQSMLAALTGMHASNASLYDGATALAEAALMALRAAPGVRRILVSRATHPAYRAVLRTYLAHYELEIIEIGFDTHSGSLDCRALRELAGPDAACFIQSPNYFGVVEPLENIAPLARTCAFWGVTVCEALSLGLLERPGDFEPDVVCGEAQSLGNYPSAGGPLLGFFCTGKQHLRRMPGRIVGQTVDSLGTPAFCLTLATREQHIRREKATSNICTNEGLCSVRAAIYLSAMGPAGLRQTALRCATGARRLREILEQAGYQTVFNGPCFNEFVVRMPTAKQNDLEASGIVPGIRLEHDYPELPDTVLMCATELTTQEDLACLQKNL